MCGEPTTSQTQLNKNSLENAGRWRNEERKQQQQQQQKNNEIEKRKWGNDYKRDKWTSGEQMNTKQPQEWEEEEVGWETNMSGVWRERVWERRSSLVVVIDDVGRIENEPPIH